MSRKPFDRTIEMDRSAMDTGRYRKNHASLVVLQGTEIGRDFRLKRGAMIVGRGFGAAIRITDDLASRDHARIEYRWDPEQRIGAFHLIDLGSTNHTFVNTTRIDRVELRDGDKIQIGNTVLKFVLLDDIEARYHEEVRNRISYDQLTGLLTKESLCLALEMELKRCLRYDLPLSLLMMDLDRFKAVNDTHGHPMGDHVLEEAGRLVRESIRAVDVAARYGGEEFLAYLSEATIVGAGQVAERIRRTVESHTFTMEGTTLNVTISIGIASCPQHGQDITTLIERADRALYRAKQRGRNRVCIETKD